MKDEYKVINLSVVAGLLLWVIDAVIDSFIFKERPLWDSLIFDISAHEFYSRVLFLASFILFGIVVSALISRHKKADEALDKSVRFLNCHRRMI